MKHNVGHRIRSLREALGLSLTDLAARAGCSRSYIWQLEGNRAAPTGEVLERVARALETRPELLAVREPLEAVAANANAHRDKEPTLGMLLEEVAELAGALEGRHEHPPEVELIQIAGICVNWLRRRGRGEAET